MKPVQPTATKLRSLALAGVLSFISVGSQAALVPPLTPEIPGVILSPGISFALNPTLAGTVLGDKLFPFAESVNVPPNFEGTMRSTVVKRTDTGTLDFYLQLANTTVSHNGPLVDADIFRFVTEGFADEFAMGPGGSYEVSYRTDGLAGITGAGSFAIGTKAPFSADRDPAIAPSGGIGVDFGPSHFLGDPTNVFPGETSNFLVIRTSALLFTDPPVIVSGFGTAISTTGAFAPTAVPEPGTVGSGLAMLGICVAGGIKAWRRKSQAY